jgi:signal transduction histidine kinase
VWLLAPCSLALAASAVGLSASAPVGRRSPLPEVVLTALMLVTWAAVGSAIIALASPRVGWLVAAVGLTGTVAITGNAYAAVEPALPARSWVYWASSSLGGLVLPAVALLLLMFPDGCLLSRRWRAAAATITVAATLLTVGTALSEYSPPGEDDFSFGKPWLDNPLPVTIGEAHPLWGGGIAWPMLLASLVVALVAFGLRFRRADADRRRQIKWMIPPFGLVAVGYLGMVVEGADRTFWLLVPGAFAVPAAIAVAVLRHRLWDIDLLIRRSVVYSVIWLALGLIYVAIAAVPGLALGDRVPVSVAVGITVLATIAFQPARRHVDRLVGRLLFGERESELQLLARFGATVADTFDVTELAPRVADTVRRGLDLEWARVGLALDDERVEPAGAAGIGLATPAVPAVVISLAHSGTQLGAIECGPKRDGRLTERDHVLLAGLARQAALGLHNAHLAAELSARLDEIGRQAAELRASRARLVAAQDIERRRLERDLHDGVQQDIVSLLSRLGVARSQLRRDPAEAELTLAELQVQTGQVLRDLRQLAQGIHPSVLTDRGILEAIEAKLTQVPVGVELHADPSLRGARFDPDVEAAAYFFVSEGLANAMKHAGARKVSVRLATAERQLLVEVVDDGTGFLPANVSGSGLTGLRDRIEAVGGGMHVRSSPGRGCRLQAHIPLSRQYAEGGVE